MDRGAGEFNWVDEGHGRRSVEIDGLCATVTVGHYPGRYDAWVGRRTADGLKDILHSASDGIRLPDVSTAELLCEWVMRAELLKAELAAGQKGGAA